MAGVPSAPEKKRSKSGEKARRKSDGGSTAAHDDGSPSGSADRHHRRSSGSSEVVLRCAPKGSASPIVVSFANLTMPPDIAHLKFQVHGGKDERSKDERIVMGQGRRMDYWGLNFGPGCKSQDLCRYLVGVEDETTGEVTLHDAGHPYALRQSVAGKEDVVEDNAMDGADWKQRRDSLVNQFGSKKKKAAIRARDANVIEAGTVVGGGALSRVLREALTGDDSEGAAAQDPTDGAAGALMEARRRFLPPMRLDASTPEGVYSASDIAGVQELEGMGRHIDRAAEGLEGGLQQWAKEFSEQSGDACPAFVSRRLTMLLDVGEPNQRHRMLQLLFLRHMVVFHHSPNLLKGTPGQLSAKLDIPEVVLRHFLEKFAVCESRAPAAGMTSYSRTKTLKNQLLVHTLCLALVLEGCRLEFDVLSQDLKLSAAEARAMLRELGCTASNTTAQLKIPLVFPRSRKGRTK